MGAACAPFSSVPVCAQLPPRLERCLPYPTLAQEIKEMQATNEQDTESESHQPGIVIASVSFRGQTGLPQPFQQQLVSTLIMLQRQSYHHSDPNLLLDEFRDATVTALHERGFFRAEVDGEANLLSADSRERRYSFTVRIAAGRKYRLGNVQIMGAADPSSAIAFPPEQLRNLIRLRRGDIFNVFKIRQGLEAIAKLYRSNGYIDATIGPETQVAVDRSVINLVLKIDEQKQYRVGKVLVVSPNPKVQSFLSANLQTGHIFNQGVVEQVLRRYKLILPLDASERDVSIVKNVREGIADITFDFWSCPLSRD